MEGPARVQPLDEHVPGDLSAAAFWLVAGAAHPDAELAIENAGVNPTRRAVLDLLRRMGADIREAPVANGSEPAADLTVRTSRLTGIEVSPSETARAIDEIPILCVAAAFADGRTVIRGAGELRHKESDRVAGIAAGLGALGARVTVHGDDIEIEGVGDQPGLGLRGGEIATNGDHRLAMAFAVAGLIVAGETVVADAASAAVSDTSFLATLEAVRA
jgi:3-phosphoshikimate 1-carboxyvinyltransferase